MTLDEAQEAGRLAAALNDIRFDQDALRDHSKLAPVVDLTFFDDEGTGVTTGTKVPVDVAIRILDGAAEQIVARLAELGVQP